MTEPGTANESSHAATQNPTSVFQRSSVNARRLPDLRKRAGAGQPCQGETAFAFAMCAFSLAMSAIAKGTNASRSDNPDACRNRSPCRGPGFRGEVLIATDQLGKLIVAGSEPHRQRVGGVINLNQ
jgi:hypothetical protein